MVLLIQFLKKLLKLKQTLRVFTSILKAAKVLPRRPTEWSLCNSAVKQSKRVADLGL